MGMTIDKAIRFANCLKNNYTIDFNDMESFCDTAIDTMRKYQHVQEIMHKEYASDQADVCLVQRLVEIREVLEDGTN